MVPGMMLSLSVSATSETMHHELAFGDNNARRTVDEPDGDTKSSRDPLGSIRKPLCRGWSPDGKAGRDTPLQ